MWWIAVAGATIVNVLTPDVGPIDEGWHGSVKLSAQVLSGNEDKLGVSLASGLRWRKQRNLVGIHASSELGWAFGEVIAQRAFANIRHRHRIRGPLSTLEFVQVDTNRFRGLAVRNLVGVGFDLRVWSTDWTEAHLGVSVMGELQSHNEGFEDDDAGLHARMSDYFTVAVKTDGLVLASTTFYQPRLDRFSNWRLLEELSLTVDVAKYLDWNVIGRVERDSSPPTGVDELDLSLKTGLVIGF